AALAALHRDLLRETPDRPEPPSAGRRPPAQLTAFFGRATELAALSEVLGSARLVTLTGPGGVGKTRLSIEAAAAVDGDVTFVDLSPVSDGTQVAQGILRALGARESRLLPDQRPTGDPLERAAAVLAASPRLLIMDNTEHVIAEAAEAVARLLAACPRLRVLATSREALGITGEALYPLSGLPMPDAEGDAESALKYPAVRLFADRARAVSPGFEVTDANLGAVLSVCRALDGMPLALELAAARVRTLSADEIAARLVGERFGLLSRGSRTAPARHRTLHAVVDWSWDLLTEPERELARRLTVFSGGCALNDAEAVGAARAGETLELLTNLVDKSFVEHSRGRYRMLATIEEFCAARRDAAGETARLRLAHAEHFLSVARTADARMRGRDQLRWLERLHAEQDNLHAALRWAIEDKRHSLALRLIGALAWYWWLCGLRTEGAVLARRLLSDMEPMAGGELRDEYRLALLSAGMDHDNDPRLIAHAANFPPLSTLEERPPFHPVVMVLRAMAEGPPGQNDGSIDRIRELIPAVEEPWTRALMVMGLGYQLQVYARHTEAATHFIAAAESFGALGERWGIANSLMGQSYSVRAFGEEEKANRLLEQAAELLRELGSVDEVAEMMCERGEALARAGEFDAALTEYRRCVDYIGDSPSVESRVRISYGHGLIAYHRGDLEEARGHLRRAVGSCPAGWFSGEMVLADSYVLLGQIDEARGDWASAAAHYRTCLGMLRHRNFPPILATIMDGFSRLAGHRGDAERAKALRDKAHAIRVGSELSIDRAVELIEAEVR
ncbi:MAG TPA: AAA family ATPase, partial [Stackebrandtia sp.]|uniref:ATP-binding protein n=1 Tax=Stackebrandtia sp. TaxID=2023065 RepID=UPI002D3E47E8